MLPSKELSKQEKERHFRLIRDYAKNNFKTDNVEIEYLDNGDEKGIYKVSYAGDVFVASAASIDPEKRLLEEYNILHELWDKVPHLFPRPISHYSSSNGELGELLTMELLPEKNLRELVNPGDFDFYRKLSKEIGKAVNEVQLKTGRYSSEPHNGNILASYSNGNFNLKFCDAIQFKKGSIEEAVESILSMRDMRPECFRFIRQFREGLLETELKENPNLTTIEANKKFDFLRDYNDIF